MPKRLIPALVAVTILSGCSAIQQGQQEDLARLVRIDPVPVTRQLIGEAKYAEANNYLSYFIDIDYVKEDPEATGLYKFIQDRRNDWQYKLKKINEGLLRGESDETEGQVAAVISDFLVVGDLRDLVAEGNKYIQGQDVNRVTVALASLGIGAAAGSLATAAAKPAISFLKLTNKAGRMPSWLGQFLLEAAENPRKTKTSIDQLSALFNEVTTLYDKAGSRSTLELLSKSKSLDDFRNLARFGHQFGPKTSTLLKVAGDDAVAAYQRLNNVPRTTFLEAGTFGRDGVRALEKNGPESFEIFLNARRRMTNIELQIAKDGQRSTVFAREFVKRNHLFDSKYVDANGFNNVERMKNGLAPIGKDGKSLEIHHMKQQKDGLLVEMSNTEHKEYTDILHRYTRTSEIDRFEFNLQRPAYWKMRANDFGKQ